MNDDARPEDRGEVDRDADERIPWQQMIFDDIFLLVMAGLVVPTLFYIVWGLWSLSSVEFFPR